MHAFWIAAGLAAAYLLGAVPFAFLVARARGVDIRTVGSGNVGATNVFREVGRGWGVLTFALDAAKGALPAGLGLPIIAALGGPELPAVWGLGFGAAAVAGHTWPVFLGFKGGKGVATSAGMLLAAAPAAVLAGLAVWVALFVLTRYVSVASIGAAIAVPAAGWLLHGADGPARPAVLTALGALIVWKHRTNLARLRAGTEHRFVTKRRATGVGEGG